MEALSARKQAWLRKNAGALTPEKTLTSRHTSPHKRPKTTNANTEQTLS